MTDGPRFVVVAAPCSLIVGGVAVGWRRVAMPVVEPEIVGPWAWAGFNGATLPDADWD